MVWNAIDRRNEDVFAQAGPDLSADTADAIRAVIGRYPNKRAALLPALHLAQAQVGYLPLKVLAQVASLLDLPAQDVYDTASFYEMFWLRPRGRNLVQVCEGFACELCGQAGLLEAIKRKLNIEVGQTTPDGRFTLVAVPCLAACDKAPAVQINDELFGPVSEAELDGILGMGARS